MKTTIIDSPIGRLLLEAEGDELVGVHFDAPKPVIGSSAGDRHPILTATAKQLAEYFAGKRKSFDLPLGMRGTDFERGVWDQLTKIPFGETVSYGDIARRIQNPKAVRAVGRANGKNPIPIIVPCHRVIGSDGSLTGFGGGEDKKAWLLDHEGARESRSQLSLAY